MESWVLDLNKDGQKDILTRSWNQSFLGSDAYEISRESVVVSIWSSNELIRTEITDTLLKKQLEKDFPYYKKNTLSYLTKQRLTAFLKKKPNINVSNNIGTHWCIITGSDKDLKSAKYELKRARKIIEMNQKYGLEFRLFETHKKNNRYYTVITKFETKTEAEIALNEIKKKFNETAYIINLENWCKKLEYQKGGYLECIN